MSVIVIGDVHGCLKTLEALVAKLPLNKAKICFVGDLIDRGDDCSGVVDLVRKNNFDCVMGNHEDLSVDAYLYTRKYGTSDWIRNGGGAQFTNEQIEWMKALPRAITYEDEIKDGRKLLVTHTMIATLKSYMSKADYLHLWNRHYPKDHKEYYQVFGHTPTQYFDFGDLQPSEEPIITDYFAAIDTGCVLQKVAPKEFPKTYLSALQFPEMKIYRQEYIR
jgi:serine/threonine protein phosphatase 1